MMNKHKMFQMLEDNIKLVNNDSQSPLDDSKIGIVGLRFDETMNKNHIPWSSDNHKDSMMMIDCADVMFCEILTQISIEICNH